MSHRQTRRSFPAVISGYLPRLPCHCSVARSPYSMLCRAGESSTSPVPYKKQVRGWLSYAFARHVQLFDRHMSSFP